jgi:hypothetical protein
MLTSGACARFDHGQPCRISITALEFVALLFKTSSAFVRYVIASIGKQTCRELVAFLVSRNVGSACCLLLEISRRILTYRSRVSQAEANLRDQTGLTGRRPCRNSHSARC